MDTSCHEFYTCLKSLQCPRKMNKHPKQTKNGYHLPRSSPNGTINFVIFQPPPPAQPVHPFVILFSISLSTLRAFGKGYITNSNQQQPSQHGKPTHLQGFTLQLKGETMPRWHKVGRMADVFSCFLPYIKKNDGWMAMAWRFLAKIPEQVDGANWNSSG